MNASTLTRFWYPEEMRSVSPTPTGCAIGPLIFLSMQYPRLKDGSRIQKLWDLDTDKANMMSTGVEHRDGREGFVRAAIWAAYDQVATVLDSVGSSLEEIVRQRIVLSDPSDVLPAEDALLRVLGVKSLPATVFNCESSTGRGTSRTVGVEIIAFRKGYGSDLTRIRVPELGGLTDPYPQATRVGGLVFSSSIYADTGGPGRGERQAPKKPPEFPGPALSDRVHWRLRSQLRESYGYLATIMQSQGATLHSLLRQTFFTTSDRQAWGYTSIDREQLFPRPENFPTASAFGVPHLPPDPHVEFMTDAIGLVGDAWSRDVNVLPDVAMGHLPMCIGAGPFLFTTGYVGMDKSTHSTIEGYHDLGGPERLLGSSTDDAWEAVGAQAWHVYRRIALMLEGMNSSIDKIAQQTIYLTDVASLPAVQSVARAILGSSIPATTVMGVRSIGPYPGSEIEIDVVAVRQSQGADVSQSV